jgi:hypothetical protein
MTGKLTSLCFAAAVGAVIVLAQHMGLFANNVQVACDISIGCAKPPTTNVFELDEKVRKQIGAATAQDFSAHFYTSPGRIGCVYSVDGNKDFLRIVEQAVLAELNQSAGVTGAPDMTKRRLQLEY